MTPILKWQNTSCYPGNGCLENKFWLYSTKEERKKNKHKSRRPQSGMSELFSLPALHKHAVHLSWPYFGKPESQPQKKKTNTHTRELQWQPDLLTLQSCPHKAMLPTQSNALVQSNWKTPQTSSFKGNTLKPPVLPRNYPWYTFTKNGNWQQFPLYSFICLVHPSSVLQLGSQEVNTKLNTKKF